MKRHDSLFQEAEFYRRLFAYNKKVLLRFFKALTKIDSKIVTKNLESSHHSMQNTFLHILTVYNGWLNYNVYGRSSEIPHDTEHNPRSYRSMEEIGLFMRKVLKGVDEFISVLDEKKLAENTGAPWIRGKKSVRDVLMQVTIEQAHHIGEIIALMWKFNIEPPPMTWFDNSGNRPA